jgi:hypothetical protein
MKGQDKIELVKKDEWCNDLGMERIEWNFKSLLVLDVCLEWKKEWRKRDDSWGLHEEL